MTGPDVPSREELLAATLRREHVVTALVRAQSDLAGVLAAVADSPDTEEARRRVRALLELDDGQAAAVLDLQIRRMCGTERARVLDELRELRRQIEQLQADA